MKNKIFLLIYILAVINFIGCSLHTEKPAEVKEDTSKEVTNNLSDTERYYYILNTKETYEDLKNEDDGLNCIYMDKLIDNEVAYDSRYKERVEELKNQRDSNNSEEGNFDDDTSINSHEDVKISHNIAQSVQEVNEKILKDLDDSKVFKKYKVSMSADSVSINLGNNINLNDVNKDALSNIAKNIYGYFKESGLANSEDGAVTLHVYFIIDNKKFESSWSLDKDQEDDWNN